jgi:hypothetical protein
MKKAATLLLLAVVMAAPFEGFSAPATSSSETVAESFVLKRKKSKKIRHAYQRTSRRGGLFR